MIRHCCSIPLLPSSHFVKSLLIFKRSCSVSNSFLNMAVDGLLAKKSIRMKDREVVATKIKRMIGDGSQRLQIITDFDHTISKSKTSKGETGILTHGILVEHMDSPQKAKLDALCEKYARIENANDLTVEEKTPHMVDWWTKSHNLITELGLTRSTLEKYVLESSLEIRDNFRNFLRHSEEARIPVMIFSGGLGDVIDIILNQHLRHIPSNIHTISNYMEFDNKGNTTGFRAPLIHSLNKNATVVKGDHAFFDQLKSRPNVLLLGDSLSDLDMDVGMVKEGVPLKIGYFTHGVNENSLDQHMSGFDIVLVDDQTCEVPLAILKAITGSA